MYFNEEEIKEKIRKARKQRKTLRQIFKLIEDDEPFCHQGPYITLGQIIRFIRAGGGQLSNRTIAKAFDRCVPQDDYHPRERQELVDFLKGLSK